MNISLNQAELKVHMQRLWRSVRALPRWLLIKHSHALDASAVVLILGLATYLVATLLYIAPSGVTATTPKRPALRVEDADKIELWIEERANERQRPLEIPSGTF